MGEKTMDLGIAVNRIIQKIHYSLIYNNYKGSKWPIS